MYAKKHFGQHFLHDPFIIKKIVDAISPDKDTKLIEIGPGPGALTQLLVEKSQQLHAIEVDNDMVAHLQHRFASNENFYLYHQDVLETDFASIISNQALHICGNLPYNISTPLLFHLCDFENLIEKMVFMMQKEVIDRIVAKPGNKDYGRLTVSLGLRFHSERLFNVKPGAFNPPPKVDSSIVLMTPRKKAELPSVNDIQKFESIVKTAFSQRRKMLRKVLKTIISEDIFEKLNIDATQRAEQLSIEDFIHLSNHI